MSASRPSVDFTAEVASLAARYGDPLRRETEITDAFFDPVHNPDRVGEVCMVVRRRNGNLLLSIKDFYPRGAHRLPTGGIHADERILDALARETKEETGLDTEIRRFLAAIAYRSRSAPQLAPVFHTFAFLLDEVGGRLGALDTKERIEEYLEVPPADLLRVAERLDHVASASAPEIDGNWADWGHFRAIVHRAVHEALLRPYRT